MSDEVVQVPRSDLVEAVRLLDLLVVSLDRIGSALADRSQQERYQLLLSFIQEWEVCDKLAQARRLLSECFSSEVGPDDMDELERELQDTVYWSVKAQSPPPEQEERGNR